MKKLFSIISALLVFSTSANAQFLDNMKRLDIFNHLGLGVGIGTTGITIDAGTTITPWVQLRAGVDIMPQFKINTSLDVERFGDDYTRSGYMPEEREIDVQGKLVNTTGHFLFDVFPVTHLSSFHVTVGGYFGSSKLIKAYNTSGQDYLRDIYEHNMQNPDSQYGAFLGDYPITPDKNGNLGASIRVNSFRPYVGIGFGRIVPNSRINCLFDLGVQFWGSPKVYNDIDNYRITSQDLDGSDGGLLKTMSKITVYPVISVKLVGKIL